MSTLLTYALGAVSIAVALCIPAATPPPPDYVDPDIAWAEAIGPETRARVAAAVDSYLADPDLNAPACWEDEAVVVIIDHVSPERPTPIPVGGPFVVAERVGELGCVPLDNLPVDGFRPEG